MLGEKRGREGGRKGGREEGREEGRKGGRKGGREEGKEEEREEGVWEKKRGWEGKMERMGGGEGTCKSSSIESCSAVFWHMYAVSFITLVM